MGSTEGSLDVKDHKSGNTWREGVSVLTGTHLSYTILNTRPWKVRPLFFLRRVETGIERESWESEVSSSGQRDSDGTTSLVSSRRLWCIFLSLQGGRGSVKWKSVGSIESTLVTVTPCLYSVREVRDGFHFCVLFLFIDNEKFGNLKPPSNNVPSSTGRVSGWNRTFSWHDSLSSRLEVRLVWDGTYLRDKEVKT